MYSLQTGDVDNSDILLKLKDKNINDVIRKFDLNHLQYLIFNEISPGDLKLWDNITVCLSLGDEIPIPFSKKIADLLFFALNVNFHESIGFRIVNLTQANTLFSLYDGDFRKVKLDEDSRRPRFTTLTTGGHSQSFTSLVKGFEMTWKIPVSFFRDEKGESKVTLSGTPFCILEIFGETTSIPRKLYTKFFRPSMENFKLIKDSTDEIKSCFNFNDGETLRQILQYCGFEFKKELRDIPLPESHALEDNKVCIYGSGLEEIIKNNEIYWEKINDFKYILLPRCNYIPVIKNKNHCALMC